jgi:predicted dehydrogenase
MTPHNVNVAIIGGGLMGREVAAAIERWPALIDHPARPRLTAVCDLDPNALRWFDQIDTVTTKVTDYRDVLADPSVEVVYIAVRHDLHERLYIDAIEAGKDLLGEKPFGIDLAAASRIHAAAAKHPDVFVRCSSEMPFFPGAQAAAAQIASGRLGRLIEAACGFSHSSDLDVNKTINWKRQRQYCGDAGVMNDLGMHAVHVPLRLGWMPTKIYAVLQDLVHQRPDPAGNMVACDTAENATLVCSATQRPIRADDDGTGFEFPLTLTMKRIDPGHKNSWSLSATGMQGGVAYTTRYPKTLRMMEVRNGEQTWSEVEMGSQGGWATVTGSIFETGFSDAILQMWAAFLAERVGALGNRLACATPDEALASHRIFAAALTSDETAQAVEPEMPASVSR